MPILANMNHKPTKSASSMRSSQHWYDPKTLEARHGADLREAKKFGYLPSVTTVLKILPQDNLAKWKAEQVCIAAFSTPRLPDEPDATFIARVMAFADEEARNAADVGTRRHDIIERFNCGETIYPGNPDLPFIQPYIEWWGAKVRRVISCEQVVANLQMGYAGKLDILCEMEDGSVAVVDIKNRKRTGTYPNDLAQLAAYQSAVGDADRSISVVLGTQSPSILVKEWSEAETEDGWETFTLCLALWKKVKNYWPERAQEPAVA
jgi:hypothetical protein